MKLSSRYNTTELLLASCIVGVGMFIVLWQTGGVQNILQSMHALPKPETFTELYFTDAAHLPSTLPPGKRLVFSFGISNHESEHRTYEYRVSVVSTNAHTYQLSSGTLPLDNYESITVPISVLIPRTIQAARIVVELPALDQHIDFHIQ